METFLKKKRKERSSGNVSTITNTNTNTDIGNAISTPTISINKKKKMVRPLFLAIKLKKKKKKVRPLFLSIKKRKGMTTKLKKSILFTMRGAAGCWGWFTPHLRMRFFLVFDCTSTVKVSELVYI